MRLEIGAGSAAGRAGGVLWSSAILAAISPLRAAFTSRLPAPARSAAPAPRPPLPTTPASTLFPPSPSLQPSGLSVRLSLPLRLCLLSLREASASLPVWLLLISFLVCFRLPPPVCLSLSGCHSLARPVSSSCHLSAFASLPVSASDCDPFSWLLVSSPFL